ncbi:MAG: hypothetical protein LBE12_05260 [Planctomycetaceae bacterium]|jgi:hypothetical protein|nr:hypothetical protein [Planctomycetaceae bacterium]
MRSISIFITVLIFLIFTVQTCFFSFINVIRAEEPITVKTDVSVRNWSVPVISAVRQEFVNWLETQNLTERPQHGLDVDRFATDPTLKLSGAALFELTIESLRHVLPAAVTYLDACDVFAWQELPFGQPVVLPQVPLQIYLGDSGTKYLYASLRYYLALRLVQSRLYDEAVLILDEMTPENSIDPVGVLVTRAIVCNHLGQLQKGLTALEELKTVSDSSAPRRFMELAKLLEFDLKNNKKEEKDAPEKISRKMNDIRRRLGKGRTDEGTQDVENDVLKSLDQLIEKIEEQSQKQSQNSESDQGQQANKPADDSRILKQKAPGNIDRHDFDMGEQWGDLPPHEREEALLRIEKSFPAHYRDIIEQYFREMAGKQE